MSGVRVDYGPDVIVGFDTSDDAGVYRISADTALIQTVDFFTPIVDDPFVFGQIAAANGLSDVYAMGGRPLTAMNIVCFPLKKFSLDVLGKILQGGLDILKKSGTQLLGGHSVDDEELKYGISVTGVVHPERIWKNRGLRHGDSIILTKPLGTGILGTMIKSGIADAASYEECVASMTTLNSRAADTASAYDVHACTDVTGFGLAGHLREMLGDDALRVVIKADALPFLRGAKEGAATGMIPGGLYRNRDHVGGMYTVEGRVDRAVSDLVFDPQTSGGLLLAVSGPDAEPLLTKLHEGGVGHARIIATVEKADAASIFLVRA